MTENAYFLINSAEYLKNVKQIVKDALQEHEKNKNTNLTTSDQDNQILTINQAAEFLNLSYHTLYGYVHKRIIPFIKKRKKLYFRKSDLQNWLDEGVQTTQEEMSKKIVKDIMNRKNSKNS